MQGLFYELIRVAIGTQDTLYRTPSAQEWHKLYDMANKQSLFGICFAGVQKLSTNDKPLTINLPKALYFTWMGIAAKIQQRNELMNDYTRKALEYFRENGFCCQVLKGQGVAKFYRVNVNVNEDDNCRPDDSLNHKSSTINLQSLRQSGDVDVWLNCKRKELYDFARKKYGKLEGLNYYHIHCPIINDTEVEAHIWPSYMTNPFKNRKLHQFSIAHQPTEGCKDTPDKVFDGVFILLHCYRHFVGRGVGIRQVMDYYFVLKNLLHESDVSEIKEIGAWIKRLGMKRFASAVLWVMRNVFGMTESDMSTLSTYFGIVSNEKEGQFLLDEMMNTGNMGHADTRFNRDNSTAFKRFIGNQRKNLHILTHYPGEVCWSPFFNIVRYFWQLTIKKK